MSYRVIWLPVAESELAARWDTSARRYDVVAAAAELDRRLAENGADEGESRPDDERITFEWPVGVQFRVDEATRTVFVVHFWEHR